MAAGLGVAERSEVALGGFSHCGASLARRRSRPGARDSPEWTTQTASIVGQGHVLDAVDAVRTIVVRAAVIRLPSTAAQSISSA